MINYTKKIYRKETDQQHYLHIKSKHPISLKDLPYSQAIQINQISSNQVDLNNSVREMKNSFVKKGYHSSLTNKNFKRISLVNSIDLIRGKDTQKSNTLPLIIA